MSVHFNAAKSPVTHRALNHIEDAPGIAGCVDKGKTDQPVGMMRNDLGRIAVRGSVEVGDLFRLERYATLWQMTSRVSARTKAALADIFALVLYFTTAHFVLR